MNTSETTKPTVGIAVVLTNALPTEASTRWLIKAINVQDNSIVELWSNKQEDYQAGAQIGFIGQWKEVDDINDPRKKVTRQFFDIVPAEGIIALQKLQSNA
tara:strand:- start:572 stop:874 length:303 start_codon:yes stop_codon:yes gene_type:complete